MITTYFRTVRHKKLQTLDVPRTGVWVHAEDPTGNEIAGMCTKLGVDEEIVRDALDPHEVPRVEVEGGVTYVFTRVPQAHDDIDMSTVPVLIALGDTFVLTVAPQHVVFLDRFTSASVDFYTTQKVKLFIQFFAAITAVYNRRLTFIAKRVRAMNATDIADTRDVKNFVETERILNDYLSALSPTGRVLRRLLVGNVTRFEFHEIDEDIVEDLLVDTEQLEAMCHATLKNIVGIRRAHATIATTDLNRTIRMLTALTIILTIPTIVSSFFGMNVPVPLAQSPLSFTIIVGATTIFVLLILWTFYRKRWL